MAIDIFTLTLFSLSCKAKFFLFNLIIQLNKCGKILFLNCGIKYWIYYVHSGKENVDVPRCFDHMHYVDLFNLESHKPNLLNFVGWNNITAMADWTRSVKVKVPFWHPRERKTSSAVSIVNVGFFYVTEMAYSSNWMPLGWVAYIQ